MSETNGLGTAGFVTSLLGFLTCGILSPIGLFMSFIAIWFRPRGMAAAGLLLGLLGTLLLVFVTGAAILAVVVGIGVADELQKAHQAELQRQQMEQLEKDLGEDPNARAAPPPSP